MDAGKVLDDLTLGYIYAAPLLMMEATFGTIRNILVHKKTVGTSENRLVTRPGVDTINSRVFLDLSTSPMVFVTPPSRSERYPAGRFVSYEIIDAYTNCVALMGTGFIGGDEGGTYLICGPTNHIKVPKGMTRINVPTNMAWLLCRSLMLCDDDLGEIYSMQTRMSLSPLDGANYLERVYAPFPANPDEPLRMFWSLEPEEYFNLYNRLSLENPPYDYDAPVLEKLRPYGIGPGLDFSMGQFDEPLRIEIQENLIESVRRLLGERYNTITNVNGWDFSDKNIAHFGDDYIYRAYVATVGIMANPLEMATYLTSHTDSDGNRLSGKHSYRIRFPVGGEPPAEATGFWSLTAYAEDHYLVPNPYDRYRISCASKFKYSSDGSLELIIQAEAPQDANWFPNFLPCGEGAFDLCIRLYLPKREVIDRKWAPPAIERADKC